MKEFLKEFNKQEIMKSLIGFFTFIISLCLIYDLDDYTALYLFTSSTVAFFVFIYLLIKKQKEVNQPSKEKEREREV